MLRLYEIDNNDPMDMIGHNYEFVQGDMWEMIGNAAPVATDKKRDVLCGRLVYSLIINKYI